MVEIFEDIGYIGDEIYGEEDAESQKQIKEVKPFTEYKYEGKFAYSETPDVRFEFGGAYSDSSDIIYKGLVYDDNDVYDAAYNHLMAFIDEDILRKTSNIFELYEERGDGYAELLTYDVTPYKISRALGDYIKDSEDKENLILRLENLKETSNILEHILNDYIDMTKNSKDDVEDVVDKILDIIDDDVSNVY